MSACVICFTSSGILLLPITCNSLSPSESVGSKIFIICTLASTSVTPLYNVTFFSLSLFSSLSSEGISLFNNYDQFYRLFPQSLHLSQDQPLLLPKFGSANDFSHQAFYSSYNVRHEQGHNVSDQKILIPAGFLHYRRSVAHPVSNVHRFQGVPFQPFQHCLFQAYFVSIRYPRINPSFLDLYLLQAHEAIR